MVTLALVFTGHPETFPLCGCYWKARPLVVFANCLSTSLCSLETAAGSCQPAIDMQISVDSSSFGLARTCAKPASDRFLESTQSLKKTVLTLRTFGNAWLFTWSWRKETCLELTWSECLSSTTTMPTFRVGKIRRKSSSLARRTKYQAIAAWRILYRLLFMVSLFMGQNVRVERQRISKVSLLTTWSRKSIFEILILVFERIDPHKNEHSYCRINILKYSWGCLIEVIYMNYFIVYATVKLWIIVDWGYLMWGGWNTLLCKPANVIILFI